MRKGAMRGMHVALIAPCGMNCRLCAMYSHKRNPCPGCRLLDAERPKTRFRCRIKRCTKRGEGKYCSACGVVPCDWLIHLDRRYRTKYAMSMCENLEEIRTSGVRKFLRGQDARWRCPGCGEILSVHKAECLTCGRRWRPDAPRAVQESLAVRGRRRKAGGPARARKKKGGHSPFR